MHILDFPDELLIDICCFLCPHCTCCDDDRSERHPFAALSALSRTCTSLRDMAQNALFHYPLTTGTRLVSLACAIARRPSLALAIKKLHSNHGPVREAIEFGRLISHNDATLLNDMIVQSLKDLAHQHTLQFSIDSPLEWPLRCVGVIPDAFVEGESHTDQRANNRAADVVLALVAGQARNLEHLAISWYYWLPSLYQSPCFPRLNHMNIRCKTDDIARFKAVFAAAPVLSDLHLHGVTTVEQQIDISHVTSMTLLGACLQLESFRNLLASCPKLEVLCYDFLHTGWYISSPGVMTSRELAEELRPVSGTLKHLSIMCPELNGHGRQEDSIIDLKHLTELQSLQLEYDILFMRSTVDADGSRWSFGRILPSNIRSLTLKFGSRFQPHMVKELISLAKVAPSMLPNLKKTDIWYERVRPFPEIEDAFAASGIQFSCDKVASEWIKRHTQKE